MAFRFDALPIGRMVHVQIFIRCLMSHGLYRKSRKQRRRVLSTEKYMTKIRARIRWNKKRRSR
jgi:hypothetical protein